MTRVPSGYLDVTVRSTAAGNPVIPGAQVQVSGGQANLAPRVRNADARRLRALLPRPLGQRQLRRLGGPARLRRGLDPGGGDPEPDHPAHDVPGALVQHRHHPPHRRRLQQAGAAAGPGGHLRRLAEHQRVRAAPTSPAWRPATTWPTSPPASRAATRPGAPARSSARSAASCGRTRSREPLLADARAGRSRGDQRGLHPHRAADGDRPRLDLRRSPSSASSSRALDAFRTHESQARAQSDGRTAIDRIERDLRQVDQPGRRAHRAGDRPQPDQPRDVRRPAARRRRSRRRGPRRCATRSSPTSSSARRADPVGVDGALQLRRRTSSREVLIDKVAERRHRRLRRASTDQGAALPATPDQRPSCATSPRSPSGSSSSQKTGNTATTLELSTDVALRNAIAI